MDNNESNPLERIGELLEQYLNMFGQARVGFYRIPFFEESESYSRYMNSFTAALNRANCRPAFAMSLDSSRGYYNILLIVQGYLRNDMNDVTDAAQRIMRLYSPFPIQFVVDLPMSYISVDQDKMKVLEVMNQIDFIPTTPQRLLPPHTRTFAISRL